MHPSPDVPTPLCATQRPSVSVGKRHALVRLGAPPASKRARTCAKTEFDGPAASKASRPAASGVSARQDLFVDQIGELVIPSSGRGARLAHRSVSPNVTRRHLPDRETGDRLLEGSSLVAREDEISRVVGREVDQPRFGAPEKAENTGASWARPSRTADRLLVGARRPPLTGSRYEQSVMVSGGSRMLPGVSDTSAHSIKNGRSRLRTTSAPGDIRIPSLSNVKRSQTTRAASISLSRTWPLGSRVEVELEHRVSQRRPMLDARRRPSASKPAMTAATRPSGHRSSLAGRRPAGRVSTLEGRRGPPVRRVRTRSRSSPALGRLKRREHAHRVVAGRRSSQVIGASPCTASAEQLQASNAIAIRSRAGPARSPGRRVCWGVCA